jgi:drug/metabolite transporter (DMT)-like permease
MRRGVITGTVLQAMVITVPIGALTFLMMAAASGVLGQVVEFPVAAMAWLVGQGIVHFVLGRYCNYRSNQLMGVNLAAPVVQLQVPVAILIAVALMREAFTVLQALGTVLMIAGSFSAQLHSNKSGGQPPKRDVAAVPFQPRLISGYAFGLGGALFYGLSPIMARQAFLYAPGSSTAAAGIIAYVGAMMAFGLFLLKPGAWRNVTSIQSENIGWFLAASVLVAISQAFVYASLAAAGCDPDPAAVAGFPPTPVADDQQRA